MKRLWLGVAILLVVLMVGTGLSIAFSRLHTPISETLNEAGRAALAEDWEKATALANAAGADWEKIRHFTAAVAEHTPLEEMDSLFARLEVLCRARETAEFSAVCAELSILATTMGQSQSIVWWNLL